MKKTENKSSKTTLNTKEELRQADNPPETLVPKALRKGEEEKPCPDCTNGLAIYGENDVRDCPTCKGSGEIPQPEKMEQTAEGIRKQLMPHGCINLKPNQENPTIIKAMELYAESQLAQYKEKVLNLIEDEYGESEMIGERILHGIKDIIKNTKP